MAQIQHTFGQDLTLSATGDLATVSGTQAGQESVLRRLLTNPGDYLFHLDYGAGLPGMVGQPAQEQRMQALILTQMQLEPAVATTPAPSVSVDVQNTGIVTAQILYVDAATGSTVPMSVPVS